MKKLDIKAVAEEFEMINEEHQLFYNIETGEFASYIDPIYTGLEEDYERFEEDCWISCPSQRDLREYDIMVDFAESASDPATNELLSVALEGRGAFRRFKDTLHRVGLTDEWYAFKREAYIEIAREWCEENGIEYIDNSENRKQQPECSSETDCSDDVIIMPFHKNMSEDAAEILREAFPWCYGGSEADQEIKRIMSKKRVALAAIARTDKGLCVVGIIGAIPNYGVTGWELHPLAVLKKYRGRGIGEMLMKALEDEVAGRGGVMLYLGSDDEFGTTSLYGVDLYDDTFEKIKNIKNNGHPYPFYEKMGYKIVGVLPDANGIGKPDIWMAKRIKRGKI